MRPLLIGISLALLLSSHVSRAADEPIQPQHLTVQAAIAPGPNVFTSSWIGAGAGAIHVFDANRLAYKGNMSGGSMAQVLIARDGKFAYMASIYQKRIAYGPAETILQIFDVATLTPIKEIQLPSKLVKSLSLDAMLAQSADGRFVYLQNATPATSVTVVDVQEGRVTGEIPSPGCFGIYPSVKGYRFSAACGDGSFATFTLKPDAASADRRQSGKIFDVDKDPLFIPSERVGEDLVFISFQGTVYRLNDSGPNVKLVDRYPVTRDVEGDWAPGGTQLIAFNKANNILFVGMHPHAYDGSHKDPAKEIWAINLTTRKLLYRTPVDNISSLTSTDAPVPVVYASKPKLLIRYEADPQAELVLKKAAEVYNPGPYNFVVVHRP